MSAARWSAGAVGPPGSESPARHRGRHVRARPAESALPTIRHLDGWARWPAGNQPRSDLPLVTGSACPPIGFEARRTCGGSSRRWSTRRFEHDRRRHRPGGTPPVQRSDRPYAASALMPRVRSRARRSLDMRAHTASRRCRYRGKPDDRSTAHRLRSPAQAAARPSAGGIERTCACDQQNAHRAADGVAAADRIGRELRVGDAAGTAADLIVNLAREAG